MVSQIDKLLILQVNLPYLQRRVDLPIIAISAKMGTNLEELLRVIKEIYDKNVTEWRREVFCSLGQWQGLNTAQHNSMNFCIVKLSFIYCHVKMAWKLTCKPFTCIHDMFSTHCGFYMYLSSCFPFFTPKL